MASLNVFDSKQFGLRELSDAIIRIPNSYGRLNELNLFPDKGVRNRLVYVERKHGVLNVLPTAPVGAPGTKGTRGYRDAIPFIIPHVPHEDSVLAADVAGIPAFGMPEQYEALGDLMAEKLVTMSDKHAITLEWLRAGALKGVILDADGTTELLNLFTTFGITEKVISFALTTDTTRVTDKILEAKRHIDVNLKGETMTSMHVLCSSGFFDALTQHPEVKEAYKYFQTNQLLGGDYRKGFRHGEATFEEYVGTATNISGTDLPFIPANEARAFPLGTRNTFKTYFAPMEAEGLANTIGQRMYAMQEPMEFGKGRKVWTESNPLPICLRPELLIRLTKT